MSMPPLNPNAVALLKKLAVDPEFLESVAKAPSRSACQELIRNAGLSMDFTNEDVLKAFRQLTPQGTGTPSSPPGSGGADAWTHQLRHVAEVVASTMNPA